MDYDEYELPSSPTGRSGDLLLPSALTMHGQITPTAAISISRKKADTLLIYDPNAPQLKNIAPLYAVETLKLKDKSKLLTVTSWEDLLSKLREYGDIGRLILMTEGSPGLPVIGTNSPTIEQLAPMLQRASLPHISDITFEGCILGRKPKALAWLAGFFKAKRVIAFNYYWCHTSLEFGGAGDLKTLQKFIDKYAGYYVGFGESSPKATNLKPQSFLIEWFNSMGGSASFPEHPNLKDFKKRGFAQDDVITIDMKAIASPKTSELYASGIYTDPFKRVIIMLHG